VITKDFVLAGNATFTVETPADGHRTYLVEKSPANDRFPETYFVKTLTGSDNTSDYTYMGILDEKSGQVRLTKASFNAFNKSYRLRLVNKVLARVWADDTAPIVAAGFDVHHDGCCGRCGRKLTTPESVVTGIGPECAKALGITQAKTPATKARKAAKAVAAKPAPTPDAVFPALRPGERNAYFASDLPAFTPGLLGLRAVRDADGDVTQWEGTVGGYDVVVFND
jgi:hypothetical protein